VSADQIVNHKSRSWNIIAGTQPNSSLASEVCNAVPDVTDWTSISPGQDQNPVAWWLNRTVKVGLPTYEVELPGVAIEFILKFKYGSRYKGGGAYVEACWIEVGNFFLEWGFEVSVGADVGTLRNVGSQRAPIALLPIKVSGDMTTPGWRKPLRWDLEVRGDGKIDIVI
jgi:hypothetical protein